MISPNGLKTKTSLFGGLVDKWEQAANKPLLQIGELAKKIKKLLKKSQDNGNIQSYFCRNQKGFSKLKAGLDALHKSKAFKIIAVRKGGDFLYKFPKCRHWPIEKESVLVLIQAHRFLLEKAQWQDLRKAIVGNETTPRQWALDHVSNMTGLKRSTLKNIILPKAQ